MKNINEKYSQPRVPHLSPQERYQAKIQAAKYLPDKDQKAIILALDNLYHQLLKLNAQKNSISLKNLFNRSSSNALLLKGLYIWGSVGRGKTWLMDLFFESLPINDKKRIHFHLFMKKIHDALTQQQGERDPLNKIAKTYARKIKVLCFDEFFVNDIADAMILGHLFQAFFKHGIIIVLTSNSSPDDLYKNGLQRNQFLPAINLIKQNMDILYLNSTQDYRLRNLQTSDVFFCPILDQESLNKLFLKYSNKPESSVYETHIFLYDRPVSTKAYANNIIWFDFDTLCEIPRSQNDYLMISEKYKIIILDNLKQIPEQAYNKIKYFIHLIDILYDNKNLLILNSHIKLSDIYPYHNSLLYTNFERTQSRLIEMQSLDYLNSCNL